MWKVIFPLVFTISAVIIGIGWDLREELPKLSILLIVVGVLGFVVPTCLWLKKRKGYGVEELASEMETVSKELAEFVGGRKRYSPINRIKMPRPNWDDDRKHEESEKQQQEIVGYSSETTSVYRERFASKVIHLVEVARKLGYEDKELNSYYKNPTNIVGIGIVSDRMGEVSLRMRKKIK